MANIILPKDPVILLSYVNTQLRDNFSDFDDFCTSGNLDQEEIIKKLSGIDYTYDSGTNQFI